MGKFSNSEHLYQKACDLMPGGVNSPVRAFKGVGGTPVYFKKGLGSYLFDEDGNKYIDYVCSWGAIIHGHADPSINGAVLAAAEAGTSFGAPHKGEITIAELVISRVPQIEKIRFVNSGTEASLAAIRLARAATGRSKIIKFEGNYHGAVDALLAKAGSGIATFGLPDSAGVPKEVAAAALLAPYNDSEAVSKILEVNGADVAAILVEPVAGNMGVVPPSPGFLENLRTLCDKYGCLLIIDEVMTGFRVAKGGACERFSIRPDIVTMGKVIGGGLPVGAYGAKRHLMDLVAPVGPMYQAGTLSGNPLAVAAGAEALRNLNLESYERLEEIGTQLETGLRDACSSNGISAQVNRVGAMLSIFFTDHVVQNFDDAHKTDRTFFGHLFHNLLEKGIYLPPSALEAWFLTLSHSRADIDQTIESFSDSVAKAKIAVESKS